MLLCMEWNLYQLNSYLSRMMFFKVGWNSQRSWDRRGAEWLHSSGVARRSHSPLCALLQCNHSASFSQSNYSNGISYNGTHQDLWNIA